jgi:hypothetical protein
MTSSPNPDRVVFGDGVEWHGEREGEEFVVRDITDGKVSELAMTGRPLKMRVPLSDIAAAGGALNPTQKNGAE